MCIDTTSYIVPGIINVLGNTKFFCNVDSDYRHCIISILKIRLLRYLVK